MSKIYWAILAVSISTSIAALIYASQKNADTAYVDLRELYNQFEMKNDLEKQLSVIQTETKFLLDSLAAEIELHSRKFDQKKQKKEDIKNLKVMQNEYDIKMNYFNEEYEKLLTKFDDQIWKQLNQYVEDYSSEKGLAYLIGSNGTGTIMGGKPEFNRTAEVLNYINNRYHGASN